MLIEHLKYYYSKFEESDKKMDKKENRAKIFLNFSVIVCILIGAFLIFTIVNEQKKPIARYSSLFSDYQSMSDNIGEPVSNPTIPTIGQVINWLYIDSTSEISYEENGWMCGDYSATLVINAKKKNWRIYVVIIYYSYDGNEGYGKRNPSGEYGHAFNLIYCEDGADLDSELDIWYIEPQSDKVWQINDHYNIYTYYSGGLSGTVWRAIYWVNFYFFFD